MDTQLDLSIAATIRDPDLRASLERLGAVMKDTPLRSEPEPLSSAKIIQFPLFPEATRPVSNDMARSALFSCIQGKDRRFIKDALMATVDGVEIRFTGEQLNQDDHDLLMQLIFMAREKPVGAWVTIPAHAILKALCRQVGGKQHRALRADIFRLAASTVSIRIARDRIEVTGHHLLAKAAQHEDSRYWVYRLDPDLAFLYGGESYTLIDWEKRLNLKGKDLARWLQLYLATHAKPFPAKVATLRELSGSRTKALRSFRGQLRLALDALISNRDIEQWWIAQQTDLVTVERGEAVTASQRRHIGRKGQRT
jgi:TrfA protein